MTEEQFDKLNIRISDVLEVQVAGDKYLGYFVEMSQPHCESCESVLIIAFKESRVNKPCKYSPTEEDEVWLELNNVDRITILARLSHY